MWQHGGHCDLGNSSISVAIRGLPHMEDNGLKHLCCCTTFGLRVTCLGVLHLNLEMYLHMLPSSLLFLLQHRKGPCFPLSQPFHVLWIPSCSFGFLVSSTLLPLSTESILVSPTFQNLSNLTFPFTTCVSSSLDKEPTLVVYANRLIPLVSAAHSSVAYTLTHRKRLVSSCLCHCCPAQCQT